MEVEKILEVIKVNSFFAEGVNGLLVVTVEDLEEILREHMNGGWISVEERLPDDPLESVIGWDAYRERCCFVQYREGRWVFGNDTDSVKIIAWRSCPVFYQSGKREE